MQPSHASCLLLCSAHIFSWSIRKRNNRLPTIAWRQHICGSYLSLNWQTHCGTEMSFPLMAKSCCSWDRSSPTALITLRGLTEWLMGPSQSCCLFTPLWQENGRDGKKVGWKIKINDGGLQWSMIKLERLYEQGFLCVGAWQVRGGSQQRISNDMLHGSGINMPF